MTQAEQYKEFFMGRIGVRECQEPQVMLQQSPPSICGVNIKRDVSLFVGFCHALKMNRMLEQRCAVKFYVILGKSAAETFSMIEQVYGEDVMSRLAVFDRRWSSIWSILRA